MKRNQNKKPAAWNRLALFTGLIAIGAVIAFGLAGCDNGSIDDDDGGGGGVPTEHVGKMGGNCRRGQFGSG